jgi:hypothetical protein
MRRRDRPPPPITLPRVVATPPPVPNLVAPDTLGTSLYDSFLEEPLPSRLATLTARLAHMGEVSAPEEPAANLTAASDGEGTASPHETGQEKETR